MNNEIRENFEKNYANSIDLAEWNGEQYVIKDEWEEEEKNRSLGCYLSRVNYMFELWKELGGKP